MPDEQAEAKAKFVAEMRRCGVVAAACEAAVISRTTAYQWRKDDASFAAQWHEARRHAIGKLEQAAYERAAVGWEEEVYGKSGLVGTRRRYSDALMIFLLKANLRRYRDVTTVHNKHSGTVTQRIVRAEDLSDDELAAIAAQGRDDADGV